VLASAASAARARGRLGGRKPIAADEPKVLMVKKKSENKAMAIGKICNTLKISRATYYRYLEL